MSENNDNKLEITTINSQSSKGKKDKDEEIDDSILFQPTLTVMDESASDSQVVKDVHMNKDMLFGTETQVKSNPWKVGNTLTLCYNSNNDPIITIGPHCKNYIYLLS